MKARAADTPLLRTAVAVLVVTWLVWLPARVVFFSPVIVIETVFVTAIVAAVVTV